MTNHLACTKSKKVHQNFKHFHGTPKQHLFMLCILNRACQVKTHCFALLLKGKFKQSP